MKILLIDNYDSFVYNLKAVLEEVSNAKVKVVRNKSIPFKSLGNYDLIVLSPGPGIPSEAGDLMKLIAVAESQKPLLGICLGHQAIGQYFGAQLKNLDEVKHGISDKIYLKDENIFSEKEITVGRYHSWVIEKTPSELEVLATDKNGEVMAIKHHSKPIYGLQFHPESILTPNGAKILKNILTQIQS